MQISQQDTTSAAFFYSLSSFPLPPVFILLPHFLLSSFHHYLTAVCTEQKLPDLSSFNASTEAFRFHSESFKVSKSLDGAQNFGASLISNFQSKCIRNKGKGEQRREREA